MINLRYHIVSIVAVFLALGIGLALGSTFISSAVVSRLEDDIADLDSETDTLRAERDEARAELDAERAAQQDFEEQALPIIGGGRLDGHRVLVLTATGVDDAMIEPLEIGLAGSSAQFVGTLRLTPRLDLSDPDNRAELAELLGVADDEALVRRAFEVRLADALVPEEPPDPGTTLGSVLAGVADELVAGDDFVVEPPAEERPPSLITQLIDAGFLEYDSDIVNRRVPVDDLVTYGSRYVFASDEGAEIPDEELMVPLIATLDERQDFIPAVAAGSAAELDGDEPDFVEVLRDDPALVTSISTIDDLDEFSGLLSTLTALDQVPLVGHYGVAESAQSLVPGPR